MCKNTYVKFKFYICKFRIKVMIQLLDINENYGVWEIKELLKLLENEIIYFDTGIRNNNNEVLSNFWFILKESNKSVTLKDLINVYIQNDAIEEYKALKEENRILKKRIQKLTKYVEYSNKFTDIEPKKRLKVTSDEIEKIKELKAQGVPISKIAKTYGVSPKTIYNYLKR